MVPLALGSLILGGVQAAQGMYGLSQLNKTPRAQFGIAPETQAAYDTAQQQAQFGYTPEQTAAFQQGVSRDVNTRFRRGVDMAGGGMAGALNAAIGGSNIGALNQFYSQDAQLQQQKQRYVGQLAQGFQANKDRQTQSEQQRRDAIEAAYGGAIRSGLNNAVGSLNLTQAMGGFGGGAKAPATMATALNPNAPGLMDTSWNPNAISGIPSLFLPNNTTIPMAPNQGWQPQPVDMSLGLNQYNKGIY